MMRFSLDDKAVLARYPRNSPRMEEIAPFLGTTVTIIAKSESQKLYTVQSDNRYIFVSDEMLDPLETAPPPVAGRTERDVIIQSLGIAADAHAHDVAVWTASRNPALEPAITEARQMQVECESLRDKLMGSLTISSAENED